MTVSNTSVSIESYVEENIGKHRLHVCTNVTRLQPAVDNYIQPSQNSRKHFYAGKIFKHSDLQQLQGKWRIIKIQRESFSVFYTARATRCPAGVHV